MRMMLLAALCRRWKPLKGPNSNVWQKNRVKRQHKKAEQPPPQEEEEEEEEEEERS